jgi:hypothetical protein
MAIVPVPRTEKIGFFQACLTAWAASYAEIGLDGDDVAAMEELLAAARAAQAKQIATREAARTATATYKVAVRQLCERGSGCIKKIKARAAAVGGRSNKVNQLSLIPAAADASPLGPPGMATNFRVELAQDGILKLSWTCKHPKGSQGVMYEVWRRTGEVGTFAFLGTLGKKKFVDDEIPAGTASILYKIIAVRSTKRGRAAIYSVNLGLSEADRLFYAARRAEAA